MPHPDVDDGAEDGWTRYDDAAGPGVDPDRWRPLRLPPGGGDHEAVDPAAEVSAVDGCIRIDLPRFTTAHDTSQPIDSAKHVLMSTATFELPPDAPRTFAVDLEAHNVGGDPGDYRQALAAFHVVDLEASRRSFSVCGTSTRVLALHEQVGVAQVGVAEAPNGPPFFHMVEAPYEDFDDDVTVPRRCEIELDRSRSSAVWRVDGRVVYYLAPTVVPERVHIGLGLWTQLTLRGGRSRSCAGQGMRAAWHDVRLR